MVRELSSSPATTSGKNDVTALEDTDILRSAEAGAAVAVVAESAIVAAEDTYTPNALLAGSIGRIPVPWTSSPWNLVLDASTTRSAREIS